MNADGFVDLRLQGSSSGADDSFWPSFADIMSVIVMIFMLAMVVLLIRNMELVQELRATMEAERHAAALARSTSEERNVLAAQLTETENELSMLRMQMMQLQETKARTEARLSRREAQLTAANAEQTRLSARVATLDQQVRSLTQELSARSTAYAKLSGDLRNLTSDYDALKTKQVTTENALAELRQINAQQAEALTRSRSQIETVEQSLAQERTRFSELKVKYDKLVRPARTPRGKYVVEVRYSKRGNAYHIALKRPSDKALQPVDDPQLHRILNALKKEYPKTLYIKVIFPKESGLSYNEAWTFTTDLLKKYDYYYQAAPKTRND